MSADRRRFTGPLVVTFRGEPFVVQPPASWAAAAGELYEAGRTMGALRLVLGDEYDRWMRLRPLLPEINAFMLDIGEAAGIRLRASSPPPVSRRARRR